MVWIIFTIWVLFSTVCAIAEVKTENTFFMFLFLVSVPFMFYVPFIP